MSWIPSIDPGGSTLPEKVAAASSSQISQLLWMVRGHPKRHTPVVAATSAWRDGEGPRRAARAGQPNRPAESTPKRLFSCERRPRRPNRRGPRRDRSARDQSLTQRNGDGLGTRMRLEFGHGPRDVHADGLLADEQFLTGGPV